MGAGSRRRTDGWRSAARVHQTVIVGLIAAVLVSIGLEHPPDTRRWLSLGVVAAAMLIALSLGARRVWPIWRMLGGVVAAALLAVLFAVTGGSESIYQDTVAAVMVVTALTLPLRLVVLNVVAAAAAAASPWLYDPAADGVFLADLTADLGVWIAVTAGVYLQTRLLRAQAQELYQSDQLRVAFLRATSHELRTPLTAVAGFADTLQRLGETLPPAERQRITQQLSSNAGRLSALIEDLLDVDRLSSGLVHAVRSRQDLVELVQRVVESVDHLDRRIEFSLSPVIGYVDVPKLERVVSNLVANAIRHTRPGGVVRVLLERDTRGIVLTVSDEGDGIADDYLERIFDPFVQGPDRQDAAQPGTGLGLTLVREFVSLHGGVVSAHNRPTGGAEFEVVLPADVPLDDRSVPVAST